VASGSVIAPSRLGKGAASPACAVCPGALNLLSQVGATAPVPFGSRSAAPDCLSVGSRLLRQHEHRRIGRCEVIIRPKIGQPRCTDDARRRGNREQLGAHARIVSRASDRRRRMNALTCEFED
jgi:hypothetical protein